MSELPEAPDTPSPVAAATARLLRWFGPGQTAWIPIAAAHAAVLVTWRHVQAISTAAQAFPKRAIGPAILAGVDPTRRLPEFFFSLAFALGLFFLILAVVTPLWRWATADVAPPQLRRIDGWLGGTFGVGLFLTATDLALLRVQWDCGPWLLPIGTAGALAMLICRLVRQRPPASLLVACGLLPIAVRFGLQTFQAQPITLPLNSFTMLLGASLVLWLVLGLVTRHLSGPALWRLSRRLELACTPLFFIPVAPIFGSELAWHRALATGKQVAAAGVAGGVMVALVVAGAAAFALYPLVSRRWPTGLARLGRRLPQDLWAPAIAVSANLYTSWVASKPQNLDLLHLGANIMPAEQLVDFKLLPFVDTWYARGFQDLLPPLIYRLWNGSTHPLDSSVWMVPFGAAVAAVLTYLVLRELVSPWVAAVMVVFLPVLASVLNQYYVFALFPGLVLLWAVRAPGRFRYAMLWASVIFSFAWMPTVALGAAPGVAAVAALLAVRHGRGALKELVLTGAAVLGSAFTLYALLVVLRGHSLGETLALISAFSEADRLIGSYAIIVRSEAPILVLTQYAVFPVLGVAGVLVAGWQLLTARRLQAAAVLTAFISLAGLSIFLRAFHRHALVEGFQTSFLIFVACAIPLLVVKSRTLAFSLSAGVALWFCTFILTPTFPGLKSGGSLVYEPWLIYPTWNPQQERVAMEAHDRNRIDALKRFFDAEMRPEQSFADLTNGQLLYGLTLRRVPFFLHSTQLIQSEPPQRVYLKQWKRALDADQMPLVVVSSSFFGANIDDIPSTMGLYLISEFIYQHYEPYARVADFEIWRATTGPTPPNQTARALPPTLFAPEFRRLEAGAQPRAAELEASAPVPDLVPGSQVFSISAPPSGALQCTNESCPAVRFEYSSVSSGVLRVLYRAGAQGFTEAAQVPIGPARDAWTPSIVLRPSEPWRELAIVAPPAAGVALTQAELAAVPPLAETPVLNDMAPDRDSLVARPDSEDPHISRFLRWSELNLLCRGNTCPAVRFRYTVDQPGNLQLYFRDREHGFSVEASREIPLEPNRDLWTPWVTLPTGLNAIADVRLDPPARARFRLLGGEVRQKSRPGLAVRQRYDLKALPLMWGSFDAKEAAKKTAELASLLKAPAGLHPGQMMAFDLSPQLRRPEGNYLHLRLASGGTGSLVVTIAEQGSNEALGTASFDFVASVEPKDYLVRISSLEAWYSSERPSVRIANVGGAPAQVQAVVVRQGD